MYELKMTCIYMKNNIIFLCKFFPYIGIKLHVFQLYLPTNSTSKVFSSRARKKVIETLSPGFNALRRLENSLSPETEFVPILTITSPF